MPQTPCRWCREGSETAGQGQRDELATGRGRSPFSRCSMRRGRSCKILLRDPAWRTGCKGKEQTQRGLSNVIAVTQAICDGVVDEQLGSWRNSIKPARVSEEPARPGESPHVDSVSKRPTPRKTPPHPRTGQGRLKTPSEGHSTRQDGLPYLGLTRCPSRPFLSLSSCP